MDLGAFVQIDDYSRLLEKNGIEIPRLRGIRYMAMEEPIDLKKEINWVYECAVAAEELITSEPRWCINSDIRSFDSVSDFYLKYYCNYDYVDGEKDWIPKSVRWDRVHGKHRKNIKFEAKRSVKRKVAQWKTFNKYVGRKDVLMIHARIGGYNWIDYGGEEIAAQPWFFEKVDDSFDSTYCDIYVKI